MGYKDAPIAVQCQGCHSLYCEQCTTMFMSWACPKKGCFSKLEPEHIHYKLKEILMVLKVFCPGCK
jgi:hypothetical protein